MSHAIQVGLIGVIANVSMSATLTRSAEVELGDIKRMILRREVSRAAFKFVTTTPGPVMDNLLVLWDGDARKVLKIVEVTLH